MWASGRGAFIEFLDLPTSLSFFNFYSKSPPLIASSSIPLKVAFAKSSSPVPLNIQAAMNSVPPATRVAYVGGLEESQLNEAYLLDKFSSYGAIESVRMLKEKKTAFIHFVTVASAIKLISLLGSSSPVSLGLPGSKICYGKDRFPVSSARQISEQRLAVPSVAMPKLQTAQNIPMSQFSTFCMQNSHLFKVAGVPAPFTQNHRTIFLGSIPEETCLSDLANVIRGGPLFNLKIVPEKNCAFITFVKASDALLFYVSTVGHRPIISHLEQAVCDSENKPDDSKTNISPDVPGIFVLGRKIYKIGFGKPIDLTNEMLEAIEKGGATRNIYIGLPKKSDALDFFIDELPDDSTIISEFSQYGTIESVVRVPEKQVAFVNFASIVSALKALVGSRSNRVFESCKIIYGKDRCSTQVAAPPYFDSGNPYSVAISNGVGISSQHAPIPNWPIPPPPLPGILPPTFPFQPQAGISPSINYPKN
ncbi:hypothetical protein DI09_154p80 [Mitosporidium daphniae]|uniref:RRM domain-containing protein n=1 Tax=Mitosporidium daphniae TaxID=1485682 RepID=A0A098VTZ2_9MICR|nr:uncharacterized protein DI09_154p80 [Mitosporidium daphniae]KGG52598.1 hypothetical protein DI09_154p80 [Mitosporidium daphniae]|eukprot:XP_013239034.1 uncharacterized protein DI09_154p80 [Mitosporidium daphniae]